MTTYNVTTNLGDVPQNGEGAEVTKGIDASLGDISAYETLTFENAYQQYIASVQLDQHQAAKSEIEQHHLDPTNPTKADTLGAREQTSEAPLMDFREKVKSIPYSSLAVTQFLVQDFGNFKPDEMLNQALTKSSTNNLDSSKIAHHSDAAASLSGDAASILSISLGNGLTVDGEHSKNANDPNSAAHHIMQVLNLPDF